MYRETTSCVQNESGAYTTGRLAWHSWQAQAAILSEQNNTQGDILKSFPVLTNTRMLVLGMSLRTA